MDNKRSNEQAARGGRNVAFTEDDDLLDKKVTNEDVLRRAKTERQLMKQIMKRQCSFLGHIARKWGLEYQMVTRKVKGKRDRGRQRQIFLGWLGKCLDRRRVDIIHLAENRTLYHAVTSNFRI